MVNYLFKRFTAADCIAVVDADIRILKQRNLLAT